MSTRKHRKSLVSSTRKRHFGPAAPTPARLKAASANLKRSKISAARQVANAVSMGFLGIEKKFLDVAKADTAVAVAAALTGGEYDPSTGCTGCLSCPAQGDTEQSRDGKRIVIDSLILKGYVQNAGTISSGVDLACVKVFVAVVLDTQSNGAQLNSEDVFKSLGAADILNCDPTKNLLFGSRFRILKSQVFDVTSIGSFTAAAVYASNGVRREFDWYIPFKGGLQVNLNAGTTADVANVIDNSIHVVAFSTLVGATIGYNGRIRFQG